MGAEPLNVAVIGVGGVGAMTLRGLCDSEIVRVVGVSDRDPHAAETARRTFDIPAFTDNRSLLAETRPEAVYLAVPPRAAADLVPACAERGIHVWKEQPLARDLAEGAAMVRLMDKAGLKLAVGTQWRFAPGYRRARELAGRIGQVFLCRTHYYFNWGPDLDWRGDRASAGGGALLELGYHPIDLLLAIRGMPEEVYGLSIGGGRGGSHDEIRPVYDTEDTGAALLRYRDRSMATVVATRNSGPVSEGVSIHGRDGSLSATSESCLLRDVDGNVLDRFDADTAPVGTFRRQGEAFARAVIEGATRYEACGWENLLNLAVIEATYLAGRTNHPENPAALLQTHGLTVEKCLSHCPERPAPPGPPRAETPEEPPVD